MFIFSIFSTSQFFVVSILLQVQLTISLLLGVVIAHYFSIISNDIISVIDDSFLSIVDLGEYTKKGASSFYKNATLEITD